MTNAAFSPDNKYVVVGFRPVARPSRRMNPDHNVLKLFDVKTGKQVRTLKTFSLWPVDFLAFLPEGKVVAGWEQICKIWDAGTGSLLRSLPLIPRAISPDGTLIIGY